MPKTIYSDGLTSGQRWKKRNPEKHKALQRKYFLKGRYGLTVEQYEEMLKKQDSKCAICGSKDKRNDRVDYFAIDHCHTTGTIRELLCHSCNRGLGYLNDSIHTLKAALRYLEKHS